MFNEVAKFHKISRERFNIDFSGSEALYEDIKLPERATVYSAGYDFYAVEDIIINVGEAVIIPTGIRAEILPGWFLGIYPRSGMGFKYGVALFNTVGIIDGDYFNADNEGHIFIKLALRSGVEIPSPLVIKKGTAFAQGVFMMYGITCDDNVSAERKGGFGSTDK